MARAASAGGTARVAAVGATVRIEHFDAPALVPSLAVSFGGRFRSLSLGSPSLEDVFIDPAGYEKLEARDDKKWNFFVAGPWNHGGWHSEGTRLGPITFGSATGQYYSEKIHDAWFGYWLRGEGSLQLAEATAFETGSNQWRQYDRVLQQFAPGLENGYARLTVVEGDDSFFAYSVLNDGPAPNTGTSDGSYVPMSR